MIIDTRRLFSRLLRTLEVETVCDVGSMDGSDARRFRRALPDADIIALEPNPRNFALMQADAKLQRRRIRVLPLAASDRDGEAPFFVVKAEYAARNDYRGMSSLHRRSDSSLLAEIVSVRTVRLDDLLRGNGGRIALWIDTEGMACETIEGASGVLDRTQLLHVEVETMVCIGAAQRLFPDAERLLIDAGFALLGTDQPRTAAQLNALFVRADLLRTKAAEIQRQIAADRLQRQIRRALRPMLPRPLRRFIVRRLDAVRL